MLRSRWVIVILRSGKYLGSYMYLSYLGRQLVITPRFDSTVIAAVYLILLLSSVL